MSIVALESATLIILLSFQTIERAFGLLRSRFKRISVLRQKSLHKMVRITMAAAVLHNICIMEDDNVQYYLRTADAIPPPRPQPFLQPTHNALNTNAGRYKRNLIMGDVVRNG